MPFADVYVCRNRADAYLLGYWAESINIIDWIKQHQGPLRNYSIIELNESNRILTLNGPFAWELCAKAVGTEILGMPFLSIMPVKSAMVFRAGITGASAAVEIVAAKDRISGISGHARSQGKRMEQKTHEFHDEKPCQRK